MRKINFEDLTIEEQNQLKAIYGTQSFKNNSYSKNAIKSLEELTEQEKSYFSKDNMITSNFFVQKLYKVKGNIVPLKFNLAMNRMIESTEELRMNYCTLKNRTIKVYFENMSNKPQVIYRNMMQAIDIDLALKNVLEADMRQEFDLARGNLIRVGVYHTAEEEYAVLVTIPQLIENKIDVQNLIRDARNLEREPTKLKETFPLNAIVSEPIKNYWSNMLKDLSTMPTIPFGVESNEGYQQKVYRWSIAQTIMTELKNKTNANKMMMMATFQSAWAILLQEFNKMYDITFSTLVQDKKTSYFNMIPVRIKIDSKLTPQNIIENQFKQILISQPYSSNNFSVIQEVMESYNKKFDHYLSFGDFLIEEKLYSSAKGLAEGELITQKSYNAQSTQLGIYFHYNEDGMTITIFYDKNKFVDNFGELISKRYDLILKQMMSDWNLNYESFIQRYDDNLIAEPMPTEYDDNKYLRNFMSQLKLLQDDKEGTLQQLIRISKMKIYFEGDRITEEDLLENAIFVASGKILRLIERKDGWYDTLDVMKENTWINEIVLLPTRKVKMSAEVLTEKAVLVFIKKQDLENYLKNEPEVEYKILIEIITRMENYQRLWLKA